MSNLRLSTGRLAGAVSLIILLTGCQTMPRHFDGAMGYTFEQQDGRWRISYTDEAVRDWNTLESQALLACAGETGQPVDDLRLSELERSEFERNVPVPVTYPAGVIVTPTGGSNGTMTMVESPQTFNQTEHVIRRVAFRRSSGICQSV